MRLRSSIALLLVLCGGAIAAGRNIVLIVTDDQGQVAGCYGNSVIKTPNIDALAKDATLFKNAYCTTASCSPSRSVILTGLFNHANGQYGLEHGYNHFNSFNNVKSLPVLLADAGYRTARAGKFHVGPESAYHFEHVLGGKSRHPVELAESCRQLVEPNSEQPFFLYFCTNDPHRGGVANWAAHKPNSFGNEPPGKESVGVMAVHYNPEEVIVPPFLPDTPACRAELAQYYESISRADAGIGRLIEVLKAAGKYNDTLIVYVSDNGVPFPGAKTSVYEPSLRLPCIVRDPGAKKHGVVSEAMVSWVDLAPTILDYAGLPSPSPSPKRGGERSGGGAKMHGRSFLSILDQEAPSGWHQVFASHTLHEVTMYFPMRVVRSGRYKLIWNIAHELPFPFASDLFNSATWQDSLKRGEDFMYGKRTIKTLTHRPEFELYDLEADPDEVQNLASDAQHRETLTHMKDKLRAFQKRTGDPWILKWDRE